MHGYKCGLFFVDEAGLCIVFAADLCNNTNLLSFLNILLHISGILLTLIVFLVLKS